MRRPRIFYTLLGLGIGIILPVIAHIIEISMVNHRTLSWDSVVQIHDEIPVMYIIDMAPVVLALGGFVLGHLQTQLYKDRNRLMDRLESNVKMIKQEKINKLRIDHFVNKIQQGNYDFDISVEDEDDDFGRSLNEVISSLKKASAKDRAERWKSEGTGKVLRMLRSANENINELTDKVLFFIVDYLQANQGSLYIKEVNEEQKEVMSLQSAYAWDRKKYLNHDVQIDEGYVGLVWREGERVLLTDVPDNYIQIRSGLGDANPTCVILIPLIYNEDTWGVMELASFEVLKEHEIDFLEKIGEYIASSISSIKHNKANEKLLERAQSMEERLKSKEEELRQHAEELEATREEMEKNSRLAELRMNGVREFLGDIQFDEKGNVQNKIEIIERLENLAVRD